MKLIKAIGVLSLALFCSNDLLAAKGAITAQVIRILTDDTRYGGCMAELATSPSTVLAGCGTRFVTFDCLNTLGTTNKSKCAKQICGRAACLCQRQRLICEVR